MRRRRNFLAFWKCSELIFLWKWSFPKANCSWNPQNFLDPVHPTVYSLTIFCSRIFTQDHMHITDTKERLLPVYFRSQWPTRYFGENRESKGIIQYRTTELPFHGVRQVQNSKPKKAQAVRDQNQQRRDGAEGTDEASRGWVEYNFLWWVLVNNEGNTSTSRTSWIRHNGNHNLTF